MSNDRLDNLIQNLKSSDASIRMLTTEEMGRIDDPIVSEYLIQLLQDRSEVVRYYAARSLGMQKYPVVISSLIEALSDPSPLVRHGAAEALGFVMNTVDNQRDEVISAVVALLKDEDERVAEYAMIALARIGEPIIQPLMEMLYDQNVNILHQFAIIETIAFLRGIVDVFPTMSKLLEHPDKRIRLKIIERLGYSIDQRAITLLQQKQADPDLEIKAAVGRSLDILRSETGNN